MSPKPRRKMLFLCGEFPLPITSGSQIREMNLLRHFAKYFDVTLLTVAVDAAYRDHVDELEQQVHRVVAVRPINKRSPLHRLWFKVFFWFRRILLADSSDRFYNTVSNINAAIRDELSNNRYDVVFAIYWYWDDCLWRTSALKVLDANDVQSMRVEQLLQRTQNPLDRIMRGRLLRRYCQMEAQALRQADIIVAITERDRGVFHDITLGKAEQVVIPTGLDTDHFVAPDTSAEADNVVFYGALRNPMNRDAVTFLIEEVFPRLQALTPATRLTIVGSSPPEEMRALGNGKPVHFTGYVEDVRQPLARAAVAVLPLRIGWGIRGRVFELMSLGVPVVATPKAVEGMGLVEGDGIVLAESPDAIANAVHTILRDPKRRAELGRRGRAWAVQHVSLAATYGRLADYLAARCEAGAQGA